METRRFGMKWYWIALVAIAVFSVLPLISGISAAYIAEAHGCRLDEGSVHPCLVFGLDWGSPLYAMGVLTWLMFFTFPAAFVLLLVWIGALLIHRLLWRRAQQKASRS